MKPSSILDIPDKTYTVTQWNRQVPPLVHPQGPQLASPRPMAAPQYPHEEGRKKQAALLIEVSCLADANMVKKTANKISQYRNLEIAMKKCFSLKKAHPISSAMS
eukprot:3038198-Ditylum_brightwellii.AAC.1